MWTRALTVTRPWGQGEFSPQTWLTRGVTRSCDRHLLWMGRGRPEDGLAGQGLCHQGSRAALPGPSRLAGADPPSAIRLGWSLQGAAPRERSRGSPSTAPRPRHGSSSMPHYCLPLFSKIIFNGKNHLKYGIVFKKIVIIFPFLFLLPSCYPRDGLGRYCEIN